ncbi:MAG: TonB-dependent receptor, partial [Gemmatimonadetes bacterium]|nr:TonB-dependent receptor [Gemmatimonadota bacterium]
MGYWSSRSVGRAALLALTATTTVAAQDRGTLSGRVTDAGSSAPLQAATISITGTGFGASTRADGSYRVSLPPGRYEVRARLLGYEAQRDTIQVTSGGSVTKDFALTKGVTNLEQVVVTGTRQQNRTVVEAAVPIDVLTTKDLKMSGRTETAQIIQMLAPSFNFPRATIADGTDHVRPASLRGLGPDQLLVLVNGKRRHTSALVNVNATGRGSTGVDLNAIPASAIERIEVLRDGAAAQYGSDAIAGVINVILKSNAQTEFGTTIGQTAEGDGTVSQFSASQTLKLFGDGYLSLSGEFRFRDSTNRSLPDTRQMYFAGDPRNNNPARQTHWQGDAKTTDYGAFFNFGKPLSSSAELYAFGGMTLRDGKSAGFFRRPLDDRTVRAIHPDGFLPQITSDIIDYSIGGGMKGAKRGWNYDLSSIFGYNQFQFGVINSNNASMGTRSPTDFDAGGFDFNQWTTNVDVQRQKSFSFLPNPVSVALGAELRREQYTIFQGDSASWIDGGVRVLDGPNAGARAAAGSQVFPGFRPSDEVNESRLNVAAYVDLETSLHKRWTLGIAGRAENYSDFGAATTGKIATRFELTPSVALRGALATGFRAPSLTQSWFSSTATNFTGTPPVAVENKTFPVGTPVATLLGASELEAETSVNVSYGLTWSPTKSFTFSTDFYRIDVDDRVVLTGNMINATTRTLLSNNGFSGVGGARYFTNAIDTRTDGVDIVANYGVALTRNNTLRLGLAYNNNVTRVTYVKPTPAELATLGEALFDRSERVRYERGQPRSNFRLTSDHQWKWLNSVFQLQRVGSLVTVGSVTNIFQDQTFTPKWIADANVNIDVHRQLTVT